jgi:hypothetical protein
MMLSSTIITKYNRCLCLAAAMSLVSFNIYLNAKDVLHKPCNLTPRHQLPVFLPFRFQKKYSKNAILKPAKNATLKS